MLSGLRTLLIFSATLLEHRVPDEMAEEVVDLLEAVEIQEKDGKAPVGPPMRREFGLQLLVEARAVWQLGQGVVVSKEVNLLFSLLTPADIANSET